MGTTGRIVSEISVGVDREFSCDCFYEVPRRESLKCSGLNCHFIRNRGIGEIKLSVRRHTIFMGNRTARERISSTRRRSRTFAHWKGERLFAYARRTAAILALIWSAAACTAAKSRKTFPRSDGVRPAVSIPLAPLGYLLPGEIPSFYYHAAVSLHFIDAHRLLFAFDYKGLLRRDDNCPGSGSQRMVRAVVLDVPSGKVEKQTVWNLYDFSNFLWGIGSGQFLLRRCSKLDVVDAGLLPRPLISAGGLIQGVMFSPDRSIAVVEAEHGAARNHSASDKDGHGNLPVQRVDAAFVRLRPLQVIAHTRLPMAGDLPIIDQGILEALTAPHNRWVLNLRPFHGAPRQISTIHSFCEPSVIAINNRVIVVGMCPTKNEKDFEAFNLSGKHLWTIPLLADMYDSRFVLTENGSRFAIESLHATQPLAALDPLNKKDIDAEVIEIYDAETGIQIGRFATTPIYTAGQNVAFSPDGLDVAIIHHRAIEIYSLNQLAKYRLNLDR